MKIILLSIFLLYFATTLPIGQGLKCVSCGSMNVFDPNNEQGRIAEDMFAGAWEDCKNYKGPGSGSKYEMDCEGTNLYGNAAQPSCFSTTSSSDKGEFRRSGCAPLLHGMKLGCAIKTGPSGSSETCSCNTDFCNKANTSGGGELFWTLCFIAIILNY